MLLLLTGPGTAASAPRWHCSASALIERSTPTSSPSRHDGEADRRRVTGRPPGRQPWSCSTHAPPCVHQRLVSRTTGVCCRSEPLVVSGHIHDALYFSPFLWSYYQVFVLDAYIGDRWCDPEMRQAKDSEAANRSSPILPWASSWDNFSTYPNYFCYIPV
jgi:hypothetical protein